ncbi:hypothetical protein C8R43DRAFT_42209 [Mycena crocata]|nr:hypothetical protein C8R43DRAFT_42209 [Mycena crocata]
MAHKLATSSTSPTRSIIKCNCQCPLCKRRLCVHLAPMAPTPANGTRRNAVRVFPQRTSGLSYRRILLLMPSRFSPTDYSGVIYGTLVYLLHSHLAQALAWNVMFSPFHARQPGATAWDDLGWLHDPVTSTYMNEIWIVLGKNWPPFPIRRQDGRALLVGDVLNGIHLDHLITPLSDKEMRAYCPTSPRRLLRIDLLNGGTYFSGLKYLGGNVFELNLQ